MRACANPGMCRGLWWEGPAGNAEGQLLQRCLHLCKCLSVATLAEFELMFKLFIMFFVAIVIWFLCLILGNFQPSAWLSIVRAYHIAMLRYSTSIPQDLVKSKTQQSYWTCLCIQAGFNAGASTKRLWIGFCGVVSNWSIFSFKPYQIMRFYAFERGG